MSECKGIMDDLSWGGTIERLTLACTAKSGPSRLLIWFFMSEKQRSCKFGKELIKLYEWTLTSFTFILVTVSWNFDNDFNF